MTAPVTKSMDDIVALCRRRGFIWQSSEIYGGINGFWDYGPLGAELKRNLKNAWWADIIHGDMSGPDGNPVDIVPVDTTIIMHPKVWVASGHVAGFNDPMVDCKSCKSRFRADHLWVVSWMNDSEVLSYLQEGGYRSDGPQEFLEALIATHGGWKNLAPKDQERLGEVLRLAQLNVDTSGMPKRYERVVVASSGEEAMRIELSARERKQLEHHRLGAEPYSAECYSNIYRYLTNAACPECHQPGTLTEPRQFNLMFESHAGAIKDEENKVYLRPETAQGIFTQFWNVVDTSRVKIPFGIAQQGKSFRNEVTPRNFTFRSREFEQMEIEFFIHPSAANDWYPWWRDMRYQWWQNVGLTGENLQLREHGKDELSHYAKEGAGTSDIEYRFPFTAPGFGELEGVAHRTDFDLRQHAQHCGKGDKLMYFDQPKNERYFPHVIEPSAGADRGTLALLCEAYTPTPERSGSKAIMRFTPRMAPIKAAVFPLVNKDGMPEIGDKLYKQLKKRWPVETDAKQSIGKRYARMDEAGTPYCFTIDGDTVKDQTVTVRERDTATQERIAIDRVEGFLTEKIG